MNKKLSKNKGFFLNLLESIHGEMKLLELRILIFSLTFVYVLPNFPLLQ